MIFCRFIMMKNKRYKCTHIWNVSAEENLFKIADVTNIIYLIVNTRPPLGFCKRPHHYLAKEAA